MTTLSKGKETHWTERSTKDYLFRIVSDFIAQLEDKMGDMYQNQLAAKLGVTSGRVSQILNHPGNLTLSKVVEYSRALNMKVSIVAYDDGDPENKRGPINSDVFRICWEKIGKPLDFWAFEDINTTTKAASNTQFIADSTYHPVFGKTDPSSFCRLNPDKYSITRVVPGKFIKKEELVAH